MEKQFTKKEFIEIYQKLGFQSFSEILSSPEYKEFYVYHVFSKIPMSGDEWEYHGSYMTRARADAQYDKVIASYGYEEKCRPPISVTTNGYPLYSKPNHFYELENDYKIIIKEIFVETLNNEGIDKFNEIFKCNFLSVDEALQKIDSILEDKDKQVLQNEKIKHAQYIEQLLNEDDIIKVICFGWGDCLSLIEKNENWYSSFYPNEKPSMDTIEPDTDMLFVPVKGSINSIKFNTKIKILNPYKEDVYQEKEFTTTEIFYVMKREEPYCEKTKRVSTKYNTYLKKINFNEKGILDRIFFYHRNEKSNKYDTPGAGFISIYNHTGFIIERKVYGRLEEPYWPLCILNEPDIRFFLSYEFDDLGNPNVVNIEEFKKISVKNLDERQKAEGKEIIICNLKGNIINRTFVDNAKMFWSMHSNQNDFLYYKLMTSSTTKIEIEYK